MFTNLIHPNALRPGDTIAIVSTSSPVSWHELDRLCGYFKGQGYNVKFGENAAVATGYLAGTARQRSADLMSAFGDPDVRAIVPASGGKGAAQIIDMLDYDLIKANPKIITGVSDPTVLLNAITAQAGVLTLHGPSGYDFFQPTVDANTERDFWKIVTGPVCGQSVSCASWRILRGGGRCVRGPVVGGHLGAIRNLIGTRWMPNTDGAVLLIEEVFVPWAAIDEALTHLRLAGLFDQIAALVIGVPVECHPENAPDDDWNSFILRCVGGTFPVLANVEFGHTARKIPLPIGACVALTLDPEQPTLQYADDFVKA